MAGVALPSTESLKVQLRKHENQKKGYNKRFVTRSPTPHLAYSSHLATVARLLLLTLAVPTFHSSVAQSTSKGVV